MFNSISSCKSDDPSQEGITTETGTDTLDPELSDVLEELNLGKYKANFLKHEVRYKDLQNFDDEDLKLLISKPIPRKRLESFMESNFLQNGTGEGWGIEPNRVSKEDTEIGEGMYGKITTGSIKVGSGRITVALKELVVDGKIVTKENVVNEVLIMSKCHHPNILRTFGCFFSENDKIATICLEYLPQGDLFDVAQKYKLTPLEKVTYLVGIARGVQYLHEKNIVHRDIKSANILICPDKETVKICDFGCSKMSNQTKGTICGTPLYIPPEVYFGTTVHSDPKKIDVYGFGLLMWELLADDIPFKNIQKKYNDHPGKILLAIHGTIQGNSLVPDVYHKNIGNGKYDVELLTLMEACWEFKPRDRPRMLTVLKILEDVLKKMEGNVDKKIDDDEEESGEDSFSL